MPKFNRMHVACQEDGFMEFSIPLGMGHTYEPLDKTQVTELVSFLRKWLEEQDNETGAQDLQN